MKNLLILFKTVFNINNLGYYILTYATKKSFAELNKSIVHIIIIYNMYLHR
jgi:hypothetical protein